jgi:glycosyltransferase involved in cell wall biosynthesis
MISICITTTEMGGNGCWMLEELVDSIVKQSYKNWEIIVSDDSKDYFIRDFCKELPFIRYYHNGSRGKSSINLNNAISKAHGEIIKPMFQDDYFVSSNALQKIVDSMSGWPLPYWGICRSSNHKPYHVEDIFSLATGNNRYGCPSTLVFRRTPLRFDENLVWLVDCEFYARMRMKYGYPELINTTIQIGKWDGSVTNTALEEVKERETKYVSDKFSALLKK